MEDETGLTRRILASELSRVARSDVGLRPSFVLSQINWELCPVHLDEDRWRQVWLRLHDTTEALAAAAYHQQRVADLQDEFAGLLSRRVPDLDLEVGTTYVIGGTEAIDFEYQAFTVACRRALEYWARGIGHLFSLNAQPKSLFKAIDDAKARPEDLREAISEAVGIQDLQAASEIFQTEPNRDSTSLLPTLRMGKTERDILLHNHSIGACCLNARKTDAGSFEVFDSSIPTFVEFPDWLGPQEGLPVGVNGCRISFAIGNALAHRLERVRSGIVEPSIAAVATWHRRSSRQP